MTNKIRLLAVALFVGAAVAANAQFIFLSSVGTAAVSGTTGIDTETVTTQLGGLGPLSTLTLTGDLSTGLGTGIYTGPSGNALDFSFTITGSSSNGNAESLAASWTETGGAGAYANSAGKGTFSTTVYNNGGPVYPTGTSFTGDVSTVPEPTSFAALGIGVVALIRRRRSD